MRNLLVALATASLWLGGSDAQAYACTRKR